MADGKKTARRFSLRGKLSWCVMIGLILLMLLFWLLAWKSSWFADWYAEECFPMLSRIGSRICGMVPFSVGEVLIIIGLVLLFVMPISFLLCMIFGKGKRRRIGGMHSGMPSTPAGFLRDGGTPAPRAYAGLLYKGHGQL